MDLSTLVTELPTVRGAAGAGLARLGIRTVRDLLFHFPSRHEDRRTITPITDVQPREPVVIRGVLEDVTTEQSFRRYRRGTRPVVVTRAKARDGTGSLPVRWFHQQYLAKTYPTGTHVYLAGTMNEEHELVAPEVERDLPEKIPLHVGRLVPVYPETSGITSRQLRYLITRTLPLAATLREYLPLETKEAEGLVDFPMAVQQIHFPEDEAAVVAARERLAFDELFLLQLAALQRWAARRAQSATALDVTRAAIADAVRLLPFHLTPSQVAALDAILGDLGEPIPMARLLAGDVGSGKTVVAGLAALAVARAGAQAVFLAPTEILAEQHATTLRSLFGSVGLRAALLTAATPPLERTAIAEAVAARTLGVVIGTHALLGGALPFANLALVIVDEQHRFGVLQRGKLTQDDDRGRTSHFLSLSATPIPRTLQLTAFGDVEVSPLEPRPGQKMVKTELVPPASRNTMYASLKNRIAAGGQVFVVCPRVEAPPTEERRSPEALAQGDREVARSLAAAEMRSVEAEYRRLKHDLFRGIRIAKLHGKMPSEEKTKVLEAFRGHAIDLLVASTIVEVGVDIPDADALLVEGAERFGLATLHQLRGRVGRRGQEAICFLATETSDLAALDRLRVLVRTTDGLAIAEEDLKRRGPGELYGTRQHGGITLKVAELTDLDFLLRVRAAAERLLAGDRELRTAPLLSARIRQLNVTAHFE